MVWTFASMSLAAAECAGAVPSPAEHKAATEANFAVA
jgi:hypothetical protein